MHSRTAPALAFLVFPLCITVAVALWNTIVLPFSNPLGVVGRLAREGINPANDIVRFVVAVALPLLGLLALTVMPSFRRAIATPRRSVDLDTSPLQPPDAAHPWRPFAVAAAGSALAIVVGLNVPTYHSWGAFDPFHEGESLGTSVSLDAGATPYKDFVFVHGMIQDPLRATVAFSLFGRSIGAARTLESATKILAYVLLFFVLLKLLDESWRWAFGAFLLITMLSVGRQLLGESLLIIPPRDITSFSFLLLFLSINQSLRAPSHLTKRAALVAGALAFVAASSFAYSIDRGFYLFAALALTAPVLLSLARSTADRVKLAAALGVGVLLGIAALAFLLRGGIAAFFDFAILQIPRYKELMDGKPYNIESGRFLLAIVAISGAVYLVAYNALGAFLRAPGGSFSRFLVSVQDNLVDIVLLLLTIFFFRSALGRSDWEHVQYSLSPLLLLAIRIAKQRLSTLEWPRKGLFPRLLTGALVFAVMLSALTALHSASRNRLLTQNFPLAVADDAFVPQDYRATARFLARNLRPGEDFLTLTFEAVWYYLLDRPSPTRFPVMWFAAPKVFQEGAVRELSAKNVKFVLYQNKQRGSSIDGITMRERVPTIFAAIEASFVPCIDIGGNEVWIRRNDMHGSVCTK